MFPLYSSDINAQEVITTNSGTITFFSSAPLEDIKATNNKVNAVLDLETGEVLVKLRIRDFNFRKSMMQKHFNENYMESDDYPESVFKGRLLHFDASKLKNTDAFPVEGDLTIKDVTREISTTVVIKQKNGKYECKAEFPVAVEDYNVKIPRIMMKNIAEVVDVTANLILAKP